MQVHNPIKGLDFEMEDGTTIHIPRGPKWFNPSQAGMLRKHPVFRAAVEAGRLILSGSLDLPNKPTHKPQKKVKKRARKSDSQEVQGGMGGSEGPAEE